MGFVLYGGTAAALRLGHRTSVDFDFFIDRALDKDELRDRMPWLTNGQVLQDRPNTLTVSVPIEPGLSPVKLSFFGDQNYGRIGTPEMTTDGTVNVASLDDLMAHKVMVILQRVEAKDYQDIAAMVKAGIPLDRGLAGARLLFGRAFQPSESLKTLVYFEGGDLARLSADDRMALERGVAAVRELPQTILLDKHLSAVGSR